MRWGFKRASEEKSKGKPTGWTACLGAIGARLDAAGMAFTGLAISLTGAEVRVSGLGLFAGRERQGWKPLELRFEAPTDLDDAEAGAWRSQLQSIGQTLDLDPRVVRDPCVVQLDNDFLITAIVLETIKGVERWETATWRSPRREDHRQQMGASGR
jgi:hypothetical protein